MAVDGAGRTMGSPAGVGNGDLAVENFGLVHFGLLDELFKPGYLSHLLEEEDLIGVVTVDTDACAVVSAVLLTLETVDEDVANGFAVLFDEIVAVTKDATHDEKRGEVVVRNKRNKV